MIKRLVKTTATSEKLVIDGCEDILVIGVNSGSIELEVVLSSPGSSVNLYGVIFGTTYQKYNLKITSHHLAPNTRSRVHIKGVFLDSSSMDFNGMIRIGKKAQLSDAYLKNDNLLVGDNVSVNSSPQLEISADDVKASHGVTISTIDSAHEFYLMSRGISKSEAQQLLIKGFISDILGKIKDPKGASLRSLHSPSAKVASLCSLHSPSAKVFSEMLK